MHLLTLFLNSCHFAITHFPREDEHVDPRGMTTTYARVALKSN